jgi:hypothetical protein
MKPTLEDLALLDAWRHGRLGDDEFATLQERLYANAELRAELRALAELEEGLSTLAMAQRTEPHPPQRLRVIVWMPWALATAACFVAIASWWSHAPSAPTAVSASGQLTALLVDEAGADFAEPRQLGEVRFDPGHYQLRAGTVHLRFVNGADLVVQGPADFEIRDERRTRLVSGTVRAIVPPAARGFTVETPGMAYEDEGTEFGLSLDATTGESAMHVFDGQVNLHGNEFSSVFGGESVRCRNGQIQAAPELDLGNFPSPDSIGYLRWAAQRKEMLALPGLIAWFPFERQGNPSILANALRDRGGAAIPDGRIAGARWATGRWPGKEALWFDRESDFAELEIPGEFQELSIACWLRVDRFDRQMNAILNSNGSDAGDVHLQMNRYGLPRGGLLGVARPSAQWVGNPIPEGKWAHVVSVLSVARRSHVIYVNGSPVLDVTMADSEVPIRPGHCRLGNWLSEGLAQPQGSRALSGIIDELAIWNRTLSSEEIIELTERGRPSLLWSRENPALKVPLPEISSSPK